MVKLLARILAYNWRHYAAAVLVFIVFWQGYSAFSAVRVADDKLVTAMGQNAAYFEKAFLDGDVFETQRLAEVLQRASRLESELAVSKATADLAAQVAHDIRSPLAALGAAAQGLDIPAEQRALVDGAVSRMKGIADDLLARYRAPGAGRQPQDAAAQPRAAAKNTEVLALRGLIEQVLAEKRLQHKEKADVKFGFDPGADEIKASVDPKEFQRLLSNLVNNAVEAFDRGGTVKIKLSAPGGKVVLEVSDNGKGVPPGILAKLGNKGETHGKAGGTGLGLYHARAAVESWGGVFKIDSKPGAGTAVTIELPSPAAALSPSVRPPGRLTVLLDDDLLVHMNWKLEVKVLRGDRLQEPQVKRKAVCREAYAERSVERKSEPTNRNRI